MKSKSHFALSRSQQNGIFILVFLIIILQVFIFLPDLLRNSEKVSSEDPEIEKFRQQIDSLKALKAKRGDTIYPFNPNFLTDFKAYQLGLNLQETNRLLEYRKDQKWINSAEDFKKVTGVSDSLFQKISPSLRFPKWLKESEGTTRASSKPVNIDRKLNYADLNSATAEDLKRINGVGDVLSERIVKYRYRIGGFVDESQLYDVYGLSSEVIENIKKHFRILSRPQVQKINVNTASESQLTEIPYFTEQLAQKIINYRRLHEKVNSIEELSKIDGFPADKIDKIKLYLAIE